jgi:hypothetical protein
MPLASVPTGGTAHDSAAVDTRKTFQADYEEEMIEVERSIGQAGSAAITMWFAEQCLVPSVGAGASGASSRRFRPWVLV